MLKGEKSEVRYKIKGRKLGKMKSPAANQIQVDMKSPKSFSWKWYQKPK